MRVVRRCACYSDTLASPDSTLPMYFMVTTYIHTMQGQYVILFQ